MTDAHGGALARARSARQPDVVPAGLPSRVRASWQRSEDYGVPLDAVDPVFTSAHDDDSLFSRCGHEVLDALHRTLAAEPLSMMLTDAEGVVLQRYSGDSALLRELDAVHLAPGFTYAEREVGTNGLGLALADLVPTLVRAEEHYALNLCAYTCAAVPVFDPTSGRLEGSVNLTTWSRSSSELLLALAQSAATSTSALMLARSGSRPTRTAHRGEVFRVEAPGDDETPPTLSEAWTTALAQVTTALRQGRVVAAVGESGVGRATLLAHALRAHRPRGRILAASTPDPADLESWLALWLPEVGKPQTSVVVRHADRLPAWAADRLAAVLVRARGGQGHGDVPVCVTADRFDAVPGALADLVDAVVQVPPLRERPADVLPLAAAVVRRARGRVLPISSAAGHVLESHHWPGNVAQLRDVVRAAALRTDAIDLAHLPPELLTRSTRRLTRIESFERDEIVRVLTRPGSTMADAATELGMSRATIYRKLAHYDLHLPR